jgi:hypothetical protein
MKNFTKILFIFFISLSYIFASNQPKWVTNPHFDKNYIGGVGSVKLENISNYYARKLAQARARADLAMYLETTVNTTIISDNKNISQKSIQSSKKILKNSFILDEWTDQKTGELFVWVVIEK